MKNFTLGMSNERSFERLPGYIDVDILSMDNMASLNESPFSVAIPSSFVEPPEQMQLAMYDSFLES